MNWEVGFRCVNFELPYRVLHFVLSLCVSHRLVSEHSFCAISTRMYRGREREPLKDSKGEKKPLSSFNLAPVVAVASV